MQVCLRFKLKSTCQSSTASHLSSLKELFSLVARQQLDKYGICRGLWNIDFQFCFYSNPCLCVWAFFFSHNPRHIKWFLRVVKVFTSCTSVEQSLFKQFVTRDSFALVHLSCEEVTVFVHRRVLWPSIFLIFIIGMNWRTLQPTNFSSWWLKSRTGIHAIG